MNKFNLAKGAVKLAVSVGAVMIIDDIVKSTRPSSAGVIRLVLTGVACYVIGDMVGNYAANYVESEVTDLVNKVKEAMKDDEKVEEPK